MTSVWAAPLPSTATPAVGGELEGAQGRIIISFWLVPIILLSIETPSIVLASSALSPRARSFFVLVAQYTGW